MGMVRIEIDLPEDLRVKAEARAAESGHRGVEEYIESLILADANESPDDPGAPGNPAFDTREQS